ncbi:MAG: VOC family protein [Pseudolabrys sp.]|nr:VOC family protein [Pseudolabrys sp.]
MTEIRGIRSIAVDVQDLDAAEAFYTQIWRLEKTGAAADARYFHGTSRHHHIVSLHRAGAPAIRRIDFDIATRDGVLALHERLAGFGAQSPHAIAAPGGGFGFGFRDPEGRNFAAVWGGEQRSEAPTPDRPHKVTHVNLNAADYDGTTRFMTQALGLKLVDETIRARFLHAACGDHFSVALVKHSVATLNHVAFDMCDLDSVMRGAGRMKDAGHPIEWGVGRHGPGNNVFAYFAGPEDFPLEYTSEVLQIDDTYVPHGPDFWKFPPGRTDQWGVTAPPSEKLARIQQMFAFVEGGHLI